MTDDKRNKLVRTKLNTCIRCITAMALVVVVTAIFCFLRSVNRNGLYNALKGRIASSEQAKGAVNVSLLKIEGRRNVGHASAAQNDGDRFSGVDNLDNELPLDSDLAKELKESEGVGSKIPVLLSVFKRAVLAGRGAVASAVGGQLVALGDNVVPDIIGLLNCGDKGLEAAAFSILSRIGTVRALVPLVGKVLTATDSQCRAEMEGQFANIQSAAVVDTLINLMNETDQLSLMANIGSMLSSMEGGYVVSALVNAIPRAKNEKAAREMVDTLSRLNKPSNIVELEKVFSALKDKGVHEATAMALANIGNAQACEVLVKYASDPGVGSMCRDWLATVSSPYGQQALLDIVKSDMDTDLRMSAAIALGNYTSSDLLNELQRLALREADQQVKVAIQDSVGAVISRVSTIPAENNITEEKAGEYVVLERVY